MKRIWTILILFLLIGCSNSASNSDDRIQSIPQKWIDIHPNFESIDSDFFIQNYEINWKCHQYFEELNRLYKCDRKMFIDPDDEECNPQTNIDYFEKWCVVEISHLTMNSSWCDNLRGARDYECYQAFAARTGDKSVCWNMKTDIPAMKCFISAAKTSQDLSVCDDIEPWYVDALKRFKGDVNKAGEIAEKPFNNCVNNATMFSDVSSLRDCQKRGGDLVFECVVFMKHKNPEIKPADCMTELASFTKKGRCLNTFGYDNEYRIIENELGAKICSFDQKEQGELEVAGRIRAISDNMLSLVPVHTKGSCQELDCTWSKQKDLSIGDGVHALVKKNGNNCEVIEIKEIYPLSNLKIS